MGCISDGKSPSSISTFPGADVVELPLHHLHGQKAVAHLEEDRGQQANADHGEGEIQAALERPHLGAQFIEIAGNDEGIIFTAAEQLEALLDAAFAVGPVSGK